MRIQAEFLIIMICDGAYEKGVSHPVHQKPVFEINVFELFEIFFLIIDFFYY